VLRFLILGNVKRGGVYPLCVGAGANDEIFSSHPGGANILFSVPEIRDFRNGVKSLGGIAEYSPGTFTLLGNDDAVRIDVGLVTGNFFDVMGLLPVLGRLTRPSDDGPGVPAVMVLTHDFWLRRFGGDSSIVGKAVRLDAGTVTVIGVLQPAPFFPDKVDALVNMVVSPHHLSALMIQNRSHRMTEVVARLAPEPVAAWEVEGISGAESRFESVRPARTTNLVGRETELDFLLEHQRAA
jgi:hypothetical protein